MADEFGAQSRGVELARAANESGDLVAECGEFGDAGVEVTGAVVEQLLDVAAGSRAGSPKGQDFMDLAEGEPDGLGGRMNRSCPITVSE